MTKAKNDPYPMGFLVCGEFKTALNRLTILQKGMVFDALLRDLDGDDPSPEMDPMSLLMFEAILPSVHRIQQKRMSDAETSRNNGAKGGRPKKAPPEEEELPPVDIYETEGFPEEPAGFYGNPQVSEETHGFSEKPRGFHENPTKQNITEQNGTPPPPRDTHEQGEDPEEISIRHSAQDRLPEKTTRKRVSPSPRVDLRKEDFSRWYAAYPRHKNPADAERAWEKAVKAGDIPDDLSVMLDALEWQKRQDQWQDPHYIPYPATYLNKRAWMEEPDKMPQRPRQSGLPIYGNGNGYRPMSREEATYERNMQTAREVLAEMEEEDRRREEGGGYR